MSKKQKPVSPPQKEESVKKPPKRPSKVEGRMGRWGREI